ncbi:MAG: hypothetical protein IJS53_03425, partial [Clostridia bacterium]|nr:hypothetical protein [Clostridia bacterium]
AAEAARRAMDAPISGLALPTLSARRQTAEGLLDALGVPRVLGGYACLALGAAWLSALPAPFPPAQHWLYPLLGEALGIRPAAVERRVRSAVESAWLRGDLNAQGALLGLSVSPERGKPTNSELLFRLAERVRELLYP